MDSAAVETQSLSISGDDGAAIQMSRSGTKLSVAYSGAGGATDAIVEAADFSFKTNNGYQSLVAWFGNNDVMDVSARVAFLEGQIEAIMSIIGEGKVSGSLDVNVTGTGGGGDDDDTTTG